MEKLITLKKQAGEEIKKTKDLKELDGVFQRYLGKKGELTLILRSLKDLPKSKRVKVGKEANLLKTNIQIEITEKTAKLKVVCVPKEIEEWIDITAPGKKPLIGHLHPLTLVEKRAEDIFGAMGFSVEDGPEIETEWYNFDALNVPKDHPARDAWSTFWLKDSKLLLRAHTSPVQIRYMEKNSPPLRIIVPGTCFRYEATDASHDFQFHHIEGLMVDKNISAANFKAVIKEFFRRFFSGSAEALREGGEKPVEIRMRPGYFPFTEPSFEIDMSCVNCGGKGCSACSNSGWLEMMGAGMVNPVVLKNSGLNPRHWKGFAFGMGVDRLAMMKYKIKDIRLFHSGDLRFLHQF